MDWKTYADWIYKEIPEDFADDYVTIANAWVYDLVEIQGKLHVEFGYEVRDESTYPDHFYSFTVEIPIEKILNYLSTSKS